MCGFLDIHISPLILKLLERGSLPINVMGRGKKDLSGTLVGRSRSDGKLLRSIFILSWSLSYLYWNDHSFERLHRRYLGTKFRGPCSVTVAEKFVRPTSSHPKDPHPLCLHPTVALYM
jgi:hypothetical protein